MESGRKILVVGSGGREHALALALLDSPSVSEVLVAPGNAGTALATDNTGKVLRNVAGPPLELSRAEKVDLVVVGPEAPLCAGLVDELTAAGILAYGPSKAAARLEGSKAFMKDFVARHRLPTARHVTLTGADHVAAAVGTFDVPPVVKADGLCAGKGVVVAQTHAEAIEAAELMLSGSAFGDAGRSVVLEERLVGAEASIHAICDGERAFLLPAAQDHKRIFDADQGPNTGGMGAYAPAPLVTPELERRIQREIIQPVLDGMRAEGAPFKGTLFAGLMIASEGEAKVLEFNVRFGDPETQVLMATLGGDLAELLVSAARGRLDPNAVRRLDQHAICVVVAAHGYPGQVRTGDAIAGVDAAGAVSGARVVHAGTKLADGKLVTSGGRVLGVTARGDSLRQAADRAYAAVQCVKFDGMQFRRDIGHRALGYRG
jgi:phosphoribosylamine---glycine ligase